MVNRHGLEARIAAVVAYILGRFAQVHKVNFFTKHYNDSAPIDDHVSENHISGFIDKWGKHFLEKGNLLDEHGGGMPSKVPTAAAEEAVKLVKWGYELWLEVTKKETAFSSVGHNRIKVHRYYTSLLHALADLPRLRAIMRECGCTVAQLWEAMLKVDPNLTKRRVYYKWLLSEKDKHSRQYYGELLFNIWLSYRAIGNVFYRTVYIDECRIHVGACMSHGVKVICDKHDELVDEIIEVPWLKAHQEITLHFIVAVCPAVGLWYLSFTTGTTPPINNYPVRRNLTTNPYMVSNRSPPCYTQSLAVPFYSCMRVYMMFPYGL